MGEVEGSRTNLQTVLDNLTSGVLVLDDRPWHVLSVQPWRRARLRHAHGGLYGRKLDEVPGCLRWPVWWRSSFVFSWGIKARMQAETAGGKCWSCHWTMPSQRLVVVAHRQNDAGNTWCGVAQARRLIVFDDISEIVSAQRSESLGGSEPDVLPMKSKIR